MRGRASHHLVFWFHQQVSKPAFPLRPLGRDCRHRGQNVAFLFWEQPFLGGRGIFHPWLSSMGTGGKLRMETETVIPGGKGHSVEKGGSRIKTQACWPGAPCAQPQAWGSQGVALFSRTQPILSHRRQCQPHLGCIPPVSGPSEPDSWISLAVCHTKAFDVLTESGQQPRILQHGELERT